MKYNKFKDIPQFTRDSGYQVDMPFEYLLQWIDEQIRESGLVLNPDFQRGYVWTKDQQIAYLEFVLRGGKSAKVVYFNSPSWSRPPETDYNDFVCVDGLQRLTAIQRFMQNEIPVFGTLYQDYEDKLNILIASIRLNVNNLQTKKEVLQWYLEMNTGGTVHTNEEIERVRKMMEELDNE